MYNIKPPLNNLEANSYTEITNERLNTHIFKIFHLMKGIKIYRKKSL